MRKGEALSHYIIWPTELQVETIQIYDSYFLQIKFPLNKLLNY